MLIQLAQTGSCARKTCVPLAEQGIASNWPYGRVVYISEDRGFVIWVGEQDHLCVICTEETTVLNRIFDRLYVGLQTVSSLRGVKFAVSEQFGTITSSPVRQKSALCFAGQCWSLKRVWSQQTNVGTGLRASICMPLPNLSRDGTDIESARLAPTSTIHFHLLNM